ncbi:hypothetical protein FZEAL_1723 [Fusarium zealandicum]|uniref:Uncharacterized protein n=1 Tax=Fusarium zealandicum TaxID=1053134 RepID=A0A8H4XP38_9HYPO|nr:hypothetical protein FZEAL_1723 [Fusarium zealandicum]
MVAVAAAAAVCHTHFRLSKLEFEVEELVQGREIDILDAAQADISPVDPAWLKGSDLRPKFGVRGTWCPGACASHDSFESHDDFFTFHDKGFASP